MPKRKSAALVAAHHLMNLNQNKKAKKKYLTKRQKTELLAAISNKHRRARSRRKNETNGN